MSQATEEGQAAEVQARQAEGPRQEGLTACLWPRSARHAHNTIHSHVSEHRALLCELVPAPPPYVDVHKGVGEAMAQVKRNGWPGDSHELTYLTEEEMRATLEIAARAGTSSSGRAGAVVRLGKIMGEKPCFGQDDVKRMR